MTRRAFIASLAAAGAGLTAGYAGLIGANWLDVTYHELRAFDAEPADPLTFVQLTDLHLKGTGYLEEEVAAAVHRAKPDFIVITGDSIENDSELDVLAAFLDLLPKRIPKYATLGNWEHWGRVDISALGRVYEQANGTLLVNETVAHRADGAHLLVTGLDDATAGVPDLAGALAGVQPAERHLVLAHSPAYRDRLIHRSGDRLGPYSLQYMLSGHTHGGQVDLFGYKPFLPRGSGRYEEGWYAEQPPYLYVSLGIGTSVLPIRLGARPEVAVFRC